MNPGLATTSGQAEQLLAELSRRGVALWVDGERIRWQAPAGCLSVDDRQAVAACRGEILRLLQAEPSEQDRALAVLAWSEAIDERESILIYGAGMPADQAASVADHAYQCVLYHLAAWPWSQWWPGLFPAGDDPLSWVRSCYGDAAASSCRIVPLS